jgi:hypothetical protein
MPEQRSCTPRARGAGRRQLLRSLRKEKVPVVADRLHHHCLKRILATALGGLLEETSPCNLSLHDAQLSRSPKSL